MKIYVFTIRNKKTGELIFAEGAQHDEYSSYFELDKKWLSEEECSSEAWFLRGDKYSYSEEVRHLCNSFYEKIVFSLEEIYFEKKNINSLEDFESLIFSKFIHNESQVEINFNTQKGYSETVQQWLEEPYTNNWVSDEEKEQGIIEDNMWSVSFWENQSVPPEKPLYSINLNSLLKHYFNVSESVDFLTNIESMLKSLIQKDGSFYITYKQLPHDENDGFIVDWVSDEEKEKALEKKQICELQVYPQNPDASYCVAASSLTNCLSFLLVDILSRG